MYVAGGLVQTTGSDCSSRNAASAECTTTLLAQSYSFGSLNFFGIGILGEYLAKVFEEVKRRPHFIRRSVVRDGEIRPAVNNHPIRTESP